MSSNKISKIYKEANMRKKDAFKGFKKMEKREKIRNRRAPKMQARRIKELGGLWD